MIECMVNTVPNTVKSARKYQKPCWWNKNVKEKKHSLNRCQRAYKMKSTPTNLSDLIITETEFVTAKEEALEEWSKQLCDNLNESKNLKDKWTNFRKLTKQNEDNKVLPFIQQNGHIVFNEEEKEKELEETFFKGKHVKASNFDEQFYKNIMENYNEISITEEDLVNEYYNGEINMDELEGAISRLKKESAPGPDSVYS